MKGGNSFQAILKDNSLTDCVCCLNLDTLLAFHLRHIAVFSYEGSRSCNLKCSSTLQDTIVETVYLSTDLFLHPVISAILRSQVLLFHPLLFFFLLQVQNQNSKAWEQMLCLSSHQTCSVWTQSLYYLCGIISDQWCKRKNVVGLSDLRLNFCEKSRQLCECYTHVLL